MSYDLHIHRGDGPFDDDRPDLPEEQWVDLVSARGDFERREELVARNPATGSELRIGGPFWIWLGHPNGGEVPFRHSEGVVSVSNPDQAVVDLMVELAGRLDAQVQGDEGERYPLEDDDPGAGSPPAASGPLFEEDEDDLVPTKPWWKFW